MAKAAFNNKKNIFTSKLDLNLRKKLVKCYVWSMVLYSAETWTLQATDQKRLESFEMWCWRRMEKFTWTDHVRNNEVLIRVNEQRNILQIRKRKANWIGHTLRRNCLLQQVIERKTYIYKVPSRKLDRLKYFTSVIVTYLHMAASLYNNIPHKYETKLI